MRYTNAPHITEEAIYARRPLLGFIFQLVGMLLIACAVLSPRSCSQGVALMMIFTFVVWLLAWYTAVGSIWRSSLTCALFLQAIMLSCPQVASL